jgi:hypothetical protein
MLGDRFAENRSGNLQRVPCEVTAEDKVILHRQEYQLNSIIYHSG